ncbi:MAG: FecR domain-containing protein [Spirochaetaceae bacterium]
MRTRSHGAAVVAGLLLIAPALLAQDAETVYVEGFPELRDTSGRLSELFFGDMVGGGDRIITGGGDFVELQLENGNSITVESNSVFDMQDYDDGGETRTGFSNSRGAVTYRLDVLTGRQPRIQSANAVAGVRGTVFTVFAGDDGSSLFLVESGRIAVTAQGEEVEIGEDFAVEVGSGEAPGEPFEVLRGSLDFSGWNGGRQEALLENPVVAAEGAYRRLQELVRELNVAVAEYEPLRQQLSEAREEATRIFEDEGQDAVDAFREENVRPLELATPRRFLNVRYWALSAVSLRRNVFGRMYSLLKSTYITEPENPDWVAYQQVHEQALSLFEEAVVPWLVPADF